MRVCFVSPGSYALFHPSKRYTFGGAEVQMHLLALELAKFAEVSFIVGDFGQREEEAIKGIRLIKGMRYEKRTLWNFISPENKLAQLRAMRKADADVYIVRTASALVGLTCLLAKSMGRRFVFMAASEIDCDGRFERMSGFPVAGIYRYGLRNADLVIAQSEKQKMLLLKTHGLASVVLRSGYPLTRRTGQRRHVLWVARCDRSKRPDIFMRLAAKFPAARFIFVCPASEDMDYYRETMKRLTRNMVHKSFVAFSDIHRYFERALVFVNTSEYEGFPNTFVQACLAGTPVLSYKVNPDRVLDRGFGICCDGDEARLERSLRRLLKDSALRKRMGKAGQDYARKNHDISKIARKLKGLLEKGEGR